ncbi:hypothetical protein B0T20DRAFT_419814 [Sordaria brevicollis]|uniref:Uncharacterized protein n=1 Tax=Sordaria brevicollis TaxID=83679 RepID=A0AAE0U9H4_SORBR|nr:hypothetical protein B0T20DRAFT_419814 [Sordaria brevicollis]
MSQTYNMPDKTASPAYPPPPGPSFTLIPASPTGIKASNRSDEAPSEATLVQDHLPQSPPKTLQQNFHNLDLEPQSETPQDHSHRFQGLR